MLSNHNRSSSSFRIIEPKQHHQSPQFQQAQQLPVNMSQQIPILTVRSNSANLHQPNNNYLYNQNTNNFNNNHNSNYNYSYNNNNNNINQQMHQQHQQQQFYQQNQQQHQPRMRNLSDTDSSYFPETTSESGISDLDMSEKCNCCPYGYHIDVDFVTFLQTLGGKNLNKQLKKIQRKRNERLQRSMEYVIDEVEKIRQLNENNIDYIDNSAQYNRYTNMTPNMTRPVQIPETLKKTINKIDQQINEDQEIFNQSNGSINLNSETARKLLLIEGTKVIAAANRPNKTNSSSNLNHHSSLPPPQQRNIQVNQQFSNNYNPNLQSSSPEYIHNVQQPRRSYSSCAEPVYLNNQKGYQGQKQNVYIGETRRCTSNRTSPIRPFSNNSPSFCTNQTTQTSTRYADNVNNDPNLIREVRRSRSFNRRSKSKSRSPVQQYYRREIKINLSQPQKPQSPPRPEINEEEHYLLDNDEVETKTVTTTSVTKQVVPPTPPPPIQVQRNVTSSSLLTLNQTQQEVQEEVLLNLFSCNNSGSISSESSESLVEFEEERKLKINEVYEKKQEEKVKVENNRSLNHQQILLEKKIAEQEKKLKKIPELEIKNNILLEEKQLLIKQLLNMKSQIKTPPPVPPKPEPPKLYRSIGCNSSELELRRDIGTECRVNTRDVGVSNKLDEPKEELEQMQIIITTLRDKLKEQTLIMQQQQIKPVTRDVAVMHVVDKVEEIKPKPELRDVAINHRTEIDDKELIEKQLVITNNYIKEIEELRCENVRLTTNLETLAKKLPKHVVTRGTHALEQPVLYSVGTNTKPPKTRDVQVMFTPKSRDVSLSTDSFYQTRDVGLMCTLGLAEQQEIIQELIEIKQKYELKKAEDLKQIKHCRDVGTVCNLNAKEYRDVNLGCNIVKDTRNVSILCNFEKERQDVCIGCQLDTKPEQRDVSIFVNTIEPVIERVYTERKDFSTYVHMEDVEKTQMAREIAKLKLEVPKVTRDVAVSVDHRSRLMDDLLRNQSSSMDVIRTINRQVNTDQKQTRESSCSTASNFDYSNKACQHTDTSYIETNNKLSLQREQIEKIELERNKLLSLNSELKTRLREIEEKLETEKKRSAILESERRSQSLSHYQSSINSSSREELRDLDSRKITQTSGIAKSFRDDDFLTVKRKETEFEQHKKTTFEPNMTIKHESVTLKSTYEKPGDKISEKSSWSSSNTSNPVLLRNEINIPIYKDEGLFATHVSPTMKSSSKSVILTNNQSTLSAQPHLNTQSISVNDNFVTQASEQVIYKDGEVVEKKIIEKIELKKPKGILKSSSLTSSNLKDDGKQQFDDQSQKPNEQPQRKALTFGENEIVEGFSIQSEQSGSDFSLDENSQNNTLVQNEDEDYMASTVTYETPITSHENITVEHASSDESNTRRLKMERGNNNLNSYDDYEMQEKMVASQLDDKSEKLNEAKTRGSKRELEKQQEDDTNESNLFELELELHIACAILNDSLFEPLKADKNKVARALNLIQQDWFKLAARKDSDPALVEDHLNAFYSRFSNLLLERIVNMADLNLNTALHYSVSTGNFEIVNLLLDTKVCDVNAQNKAGYTSIMLAAVVPMSNDYERETLKRLFAEGNVNIKSSDGQTALMLAVRHGNKDTVSLLLEAGADCNSQDREGSTALMGACEHGHIDIVRLLLDNTNCDPDIKDNDGETAFDIAKNKNRNDIIVLLYAHSSKLRSHHPAILSKNRPRIGSAGSQNGARK